jgi:hypothetical protein
LGTVAGMSAWNMVRRAACGPCGDGAAAAVREVHDAVVLYCPELLFTVWAPCRCGDRAESLGLCVAWADGPTGAELLGCSSRELVGVRHLTLEGRVYALRSGQVERFTTPPRHVVNAVVLPPDSCQWSVAAARLLQAYGKPWQGWVSMSRALAVIEELNIGELRDVAALAGVQPGVSLEELVHASRILG